MPVQLSNIQFPLTAITGHLRLNPLGSKAVAFAASQQTRATLRLKSDEVGGDLQYTYVGVLPMCLII